MERRPALRASDSDREKIADRLRHATAEGRLFAEELEERLGAVFSARTYGELDRLVADLPAEPARREPRAPRAPRAPRRKRSRPPRAAVPVIALMLAFLLASLSAVAEHSVVQMRYRVDRGGALVHQHAFLSWPAILALLVVIPLCAGLGWFVLEGVPLRRARALPR